MSTATRPEGSVDIFLSDLATSLRARGLPTSLFYVMIPPLAALLTLRALPMRTFTTGVFVLSTFLGLLLNLVFKGATAAFYLRLHPQPPAAEARDSD